MFTLQAGCLTLQDLRCLLKNYVQIELDTQCLSKISSSHEHMLSLLTQEDPVYGLNTGFGLLASVKIDSKNYKQLQKKLIYSHAAGVGELLPTKIVQLLMLLKINSLACGYSGISPKLLDTLIKMYNAKIYPCIPSQGSVGASGDLAPLAYLALALMGLGLVEFQDQRLPAIEALQLADIPVYELQEKEGLSLINGTQVSTAIALYGLLHTQKNFVWACITGGLSFDAALGNIQAFHPEIAKLKRSYGQEIYTQVMQDVLKDSELCHRTTLQRRLQDPYSLRCQPQVMGAILNHLYEMEQHLIHEANAVTDNPIILKQVISAGNFHAENVGFCADILAIIGSELGALAERRIALLMDPHLSGLPAFLVENPGLNSGFMMAHVTSAALASENKTYAHPASVDSLPCSGNQEDHVSMATFAAMKNLKLATNVSHILAIEALCACQGLEFRLPLKTSSFLENIRKKIRAKIPLFQDDRILSYDIELMIKLMDEEEFYGMLYEKFFTEL